MYSYDPVGSFERESCRAAGTASALLQPLLDNQASANCRNQTFIHGYPQIAFKHLPEDARIPLTKVLYQPSPQCHSPHCCCQERAVALVKDVFTSAAERDIYTGHCFTFYQEVLSRAS